MYKVAREKVRDVLSIFIHWHQKTRYSQCRLQAAVFNGSKAKTASGLKKSDLKKSKTGKVVSAKKSNGAKKRYAGSKASKWIVAVSKARSALKIKGFAAIGGKSSQGRALLAKARSFYKK